MTTVKICGLQPGDNLSFSEAPEISHAGFVFVPASRRNVLPAHAQAMVKQLDARCKAVGVFVDEDLATIQSTVQTVGLDVVQLHGAESTEQCDALRRLGVTVWKALSAPIDAPDEEGTSALLQQALLYVNHVDGLLFDAAPPTNAAHQVTGGHGTHFSWQLLSPLMDWIETQPDPSRRPQIWIAGGIRSENIRELLSIWMPDGIDVSSGVEVDGRKSDIKIEALRKGVQQFGEQQISS